MDASHRDFKDRLYGQFARIGKAVGNPHRIEILELLAQSERTVESLANEIGQSLANTSQHLQALRQAALVESRKDGLHVYYRLADPTVFELCAAIRTIAEQRLADLERLVQQHFGDRSEPEVVGMRDSLGRVRRTASSSSTRGRGTSMRPATLRSHLGSLPTNPGPPPVAAGGLGMSPTAVGIRVYTCDRAAEVLRKSQRRATRLLEGFPDWRAAGLPVEQGAAAPAPNARRRPARPRGRRRAFS